MFLRYITISSVEPAKRDHCVATRRQHALVRLIHELTNLRSLSRNFKRPRGDRKEKNKNKNKTKQTWPLRSWSVLIDMPDSPRSNACPTPPENQVHDIDHWHAANHGHGYV